MCSKISLDRSQFDKPLEWKTNTELDLYNPYSPVSCWVLYQYSMELGSPPMYQELNRASRDMDLTLLKQLGPFACALSRICFGAEENKKKEDKIVPGEQIGGEFQNFAGCFLLFRGTAMKREWIQPYLDNVG